MPCDTTCHAIPGFFRLRNRPSAVPHGRQGLASQTLIHSTQCVVYLLSKSPPDFPWSIPVRLAEPIFRLAFPIRFLDPDHQFSINLEHHWHFAKGLHAVLVLGKDV